MRNSTIFKLTVSLLFLNILLSNSTLTNNNLVISSQSLLKDEISDKISHFGSQRAFYDPPYESDHLSNYTLFVKLHEKDAIVEGNLTVDYYNDDPYSFDQIPFHIYPSGMGGIGNMEIFEVKTLEEPQISLEFQVLSSEQLMWINLSEPLNPNERISFYIHFNTTLPYGGNGRSNYHGTDLDSSKIFSFAVAYPMPAVYDEKDGWNIDPYLNVGDPFYSDMAWYDFFVEVPINQTMPEFVVAATGELIEKITDSDKTIYHYDPLLPVRELTFSASRYFICESIMVNNVNISTFYIPISQEYWEDFALNVAVQAVTLFNDSFGLYPYPTFNVVEKYYSSGGGMEHPLQIYITESIYSYTALNQRYEDHPYNMFELIIVHETGHQWFYHLVGNDQIDAGFLDEGLTVWVTDFYFDHYYPDWNLFEDYYLQYEIRHYIGRSKINQSIYECDTSGTSYRYTAYCKAPMIFQKLRAFLGDEVYLSGIQLFFDRFEFKIAWLSDLHEVFEDTYGKSLDWFFQPWFNNMYLPKYNFSSAIYDTNSFLLNITIEDLNEDFNEYKYHEYNYSQQLTLEVYDNQNNTLFNNEIWINGTTLLSLNLTSTPDKVRLIYTNNVLAESVEGREYVETTITEEEPDKKINGMSFIAFFISFSFGIMFVLKQMRTKKNH